MTKTAELDAAKVEAFGHKLLDILNSGMAANMISIGHRTGIFDQWPRFSRQPRRPRSRPPRMAGGHGERRHCRVRTGAGGVPTAA
jgi:hypothetical protein